MHSSKMMFLMVFLWLQIFIILDGLAYTLQKQWNFTKYVDFPMKVGFDNRFKPMKICVFVARGACTHQIIACEQFWDICGD